jgi:hypothetical protein
MKKAVYVSGNLINKLLLSALLSILTIFTIHHFGSFSGLPVSDPYRISFREPIRSSANDIIGSVFYACPLGVQHDITVEGKGIIWGDVLNYGDKSISLFRETTYLRLVFNGHWTLLLIILLAFFLVLAFFDSYQIVIKK